jgi:hypothetical protein
MNITARKTHYFIDIKVDEIETTIFKQDAKEIEDMIMNLLLVATDLASLNNTKLEQYINKL